MAATVKATLLFLLAAVCVESQRAPRGSFANTATACLSLLKHVRPCIKLVHKLDLSQQLSLGLV